MCDKAQVLWPIHPDHRNGIRRNPTYVGEVILSKFEMLFS